MNVVPIKHKMTWTPTIIVSIIGTLIVIVALREPIAQLLIDDKFAAFIGSLLGVIGAVGLWAASSIRDRREKIEEQHRFNLVVWNELNILADATYREVLAWDEITGNKPVLGDTEFIATEKRIMDAFELSVMGANLDRVSAFEPVVADLIIVVLGRLRNLKRATEEFYLMERRVFDEVQKMLSRVHLVSLLAQDPKFHELLTIQYDGRIKVMKQLAGVSEMALAAADLLDSDKAMWRYRDSIETEDKRTARLIDRQQMQMTYHQYRTLGTWTKIKPVKESSPAK